jgi:hypothetical protein
LKRVEELDTASIPGTVKRAGKGTWDGNMCINFTAMLLDCKSIFELLCIGGIMQRSRIYCHD